MTDVRPRICILGGGFGGLYTALRLSQLPWEGHTPPEIVLVDQRDRFLFAPFLYELVTEEMQTWEIAPPFGELLAESGVIFRQAEVTAIDIVRQQVQLKSPDNSGHGTDSENLDYSQLVIALGGRTPLPNLPGLKDYGLGFRTLEDAYKLKQKLKVLEQSNTEKIRVAIVGGGYSGVELAAKLGDRLGTRGRIRIIERGKEILGLSPEFNRQQAQASLSAKGIWVDTETTVTAITSHDLTLKFRDQEDVIPVDLVLWTVGTEVAPLIGSLPLPHNDQGLLKTNAQLQVEGKANIFALGDGAECRDVSGQLIPPTAQGAFQQADYCAWNIWANLTGRPLLPCRYQPLGEMLALGIDSAVLNGLGIKLTGPAAVLARRLVYLYRFPTWQHQLTVGLNWLTRPLGNWLKNEPS
ncbi:MULTISPECIES: NAD(P)/FAD-dependent oxidoreductase [unclassified Synechocystis]|uniref:NAD(P)/FAD-dependent oxidoreductase n=1 Tax=unclassified Synechocystis TaxID=2640012 RepID=UPI0004198459|nr:MULTISPECIES: NAD(P)/FAD-dependent oxidoreductase [unclassified Synechocystis]AIE74839.1 NADH dehydrogenase [Synechocystis sp. PCC 6714]MCT0253437.1 NAD(P)/FAD-dependent oxidoreductase [Synechocystis sp. CS-94]